MRSSTEFKAVAAALIQAKKKFAKAQKSRENTHLRNKYATLDDILEAVEPALNDNDVMVIQSMLDTSTDKNMHIETMFLHKTGEWMSFQFNMPIEKVTAQGYGSSTSYARRYALSAALGISQADDDGEIAKLTASDFKGRIESCSDLDALRKVWEQARQQLSPAEWKVTEGHLLKRKQEIEIAGARGFNPAQPSANLASSSHEEPEQKEPEPKHADMSDFE